MKLNRVLSINGKPKQLVDDRVVLGLASPGAAQFTLVKTKDDAQLTDVVKKGDLVTFDLGWAKQAALQRLFIGWVTKVNPMDNKRVKILCTELSGALRFNVPLDLRHVTLRDVLLQINKLTGLNFATPDADYATRQAANFFNTGSGYQALESIGRVFEIDDYMWQQQGGIIYVGSWADSRWAAVDDMILPEKLFEGHSANEVSKLAAIPALRPGVRINSRLVNRLDFSENKMTLSWAGL